MPAAPGLNPVVWIGNARADLSAFPEEVKDSIGFALYVAQQGGKHRTATRSRSAGLAAQEF
jgi:phage-related protein